MCGFAGLLTDHGLTEAELLGRVRAMANTLVHRGPDDEGAWVDAATGIGLGFRRLSILDLSPRGHQPMASPSGRYTVVFNGELYGHRTIRRELEQDGFHFQGHSDTETLVCALDRWGVEAAIRRFNGMFAIAVWDGQLRRLTLLRDRIGKKPLFYGAQDGQVVFGSELKALLAGPSFERTVDVDAVASFLRYLYVPAPASIFRQIRKLPPGHLLTIADARAPLPEPAPFWSVEEVARAGLAGPFSGSDQEAITQFESLLEDAVVARLESDVPLGALLSGGVDSSTIVALMQRRAGGRVRTFSIGFDEPEHDESAHAAAVAAHLGTEHTELRVSAADALSVVPLLPEMFDEPLADPSGIPTYLVCKLARQEVTVALTGDGGDELFAGYNRYVAGEGVIGRLLRVPTPLRRVASGALGLLSEDAWRGMYRFAEPVLPRRARQRLPGEKIRKLERLLGAPSGSQMYRSLLSACQNPRAWLSAATRDSGPVEEALRSTQDLPFLSSAMLTDQLTYLPDDLLAKVDRASMAVSLEVRVPLLDRAVIEYSWRLPREMKIRGNTGKWLLRQVLYRHVPRQLVERPKVGFSPPIAAWLRKDLRAYAEDLVFSSDATLGGLLNATTVADTWQAFQAGRMSSAPALWTVISLAAWLRRWG